MYTKENNRDEAIIKLSGSTKSIPIYNIWMMTDDEWNRLAYRNYLERQAKSDG